MNDKQPKYYSIKSLLGSDDYVIPIYQRNYEWYVSIKGQEKPILFCGNTCDFEI